MMISTSSSKKQRVKAPKSRPAATSAISQPLVHDALAGHSQFSPSGSYFSFLSLAVDKHRLRVYDTTLGHSVAEHVVEAGRVTSMTWGVLGTQARSIAVEKDDEPEQPSKKKRRRKSQGDEGRGEASAFTNSSPLEIVVLGLSNGTLELFSPTHGHALRTISHPSSTSAILSITFQNHSHVWTSSEDGVIRLWDTAKSNPPERLKSQGHAPYTGLSSSPSVVSSAKPELLVANHSIELLSMATEASLTGNEEAHKLASFTGHASPIIHLSWDTTQNPEIPPSRFFSAAQDDRFVYLWNVPPAAGADGTMAASIPLQAPVRSISTSKTSPTLLALSSSGKITVYPVPAELASPSPEKKYKVPTILPRSTVAVVGKKGMTAPIQVVDAAFAGEGQIRIARLVGMKPVFDVVRYLEDSGNFISDIKVFNEDTSARSEAAVNGIASSDRYNESSSLAVQSGLELGQDETMDDAELRNIDGALDAELAELSLGQRLTAISGVPQQTADSDSDAPGQGRRKKRVSDTPIDVVPAHSLTRTLIQALHSSDTRLLEMCLTHSDANLVRNTVRRLPPQLAVPLLNACVERLSRGSRAASGKGGGGGASSQRGAGLVAWVQAVLVVHSAHLMTMPDLVVRLAGLHATLTSRLALQESLLSLSGRLDMVLSQVELRSSAAPAPLVVQKSKGKQKQKAIAQYIEGESDSEEGAMNVEVEVGSEDEGSIEDVVLRGSGDDEDSEEGEEDDDETDEDDEDSDEPHLNGFIDDEAEEDYSDEDEEDSE